MENFKVSVINTGYFKLDGGAMFGVVPKQIWSKLVPADDLNLCNWAMRCMLVESGDKKILIDTGIGDKQSEKFFGHYHLNGHDSLMNSLKMAGVHADQITDVILTHLHFDHCGGAVKKENDQWVPTFSNAIYWVTEEHWNHANQPNPREKASFLPENFVPLMEAGVVQFAENGQKIGAHIECYVVGGHTKGMICPIIHASKTIFYGADLFPSAAHIPVNYVMGYDIEPLITMKEREKVLQTALENHWVIYFEHDAIYETAEVNKNEKGAFTAINQGPLSEIL